MWVVLVLYVMVLKVCMGLPSDSISDYDPIEEIQHAVCRIATQELQATANATITRQLRGICTSRELNAKLEKFQTKVMRELVDIKRMLGGRDKREDSNAIKATTRLLADADGRESEIARLNGTTNHDSREFIYYWKMDAALMLGDQQEIDSENFYSSGRIYYIKLTSHHLGTKYLSIELKTAGAVRRFYKLVILNQNDPRYDISSQTLGYQQHNLYRISGDKIKQFIKNNCLIVKLVLYI